MHSNNSRAAVVRRRSSSLQWERAGKSALRKEGGNNMVHKLAMSFSRWPAMEFKILNFFVANPNRVFSRDQLLNEVWGYENYPCSRTVDNHVLTLRQKLELEPAEPVHFRTVHRVGYKLIP